MKINQTGTIGSVLFANLFEIEIHWKHVVVMEQYITSVDKSESVELEMANEG